MKDTRVLGPPQRAQKTALINHKFFRALSSYGGKLTHLKPLAYEEVNSLLHSLLKLLLFEMVGHINLEQVNRIPDFPGGEHGVNGGQDHSGNGNDGPFLSPAFGDALILQSIVGIQLVLHGCVGDLDQRRFEINSRT